MRKAVIFFVVLAFLVLFGVTPAYAIPALPHAFYGSVTLNGATAPDGTQVSAVVDSGSVITNAQNPVTTVGGSYGIDSPDLLVQGDIPNGATITFYVNGVSTGQTATFETGGGPTEKNLTVTISTGEDGAGGGGGAPPAADTIETNLFGSTGTFPISATGKITEKITATSEDGNLTITVPKDTIALDKHGDPLSSLMSDVKTSPPSPPEDAHVIGLAYDFGPDGATFDPAITLTWSYDPDALPEGVAEEDLVIACYVASKWVEVDCVVDTENNTITASVEHFTTFAIIGAVTPAPPPPPPAPSAFSLSNLSIKPVEVEPKEKVAISVSIANTGGTEGSYTAVLKINGVKEVEKSVTLAAGSTEMWFLFVEREEAGSYSVTVDGLSGSFTVVAPALPAPPEVKPPVVPPVKPAINWPLLGAVIGVVIAVGLLIFFLVRRRA